MNDPRSVFVDPDRLEFCGQALYRWQGLQDIEDGTASGQVAWQDTTPSVRARYREMVDIVLMANGLIG